MSLFVGLMSSDVIYAQNPQPNQGPAQSCFDKNTKELNLTKESERLDSNGVALKSFYDVGFNESCNACLNDYKLSSITIFQKNKEGQNLPTPYSVYVCEKCDPEQCNCGYKLNTDIPFIGRCISFGNTNVTNGTDGVTTVNAVNAFPVLMGSLIKLAMGALLIVCLGMIIVGGVRMTLPEQYTDGKAMVWKVVYIIAGIGSLGLILYLINPNFFR